MGNTLMFAAAAVLSLGSLAAAAVPIAKNCFSNVCYSINIPDAVARSGSGDIFFQITAPTSYSWVALGQGSSMSDSNIFVVYTSADGKNVTLSPRKGAYHVMPEYNADAKVTLLEGSGVANGIMTANVKCSNCNSWDGGNMDFTSSSTGWIYGMSTGSPLNTDDMDATIRQHSPRGRASFTWDLSAAKGGNSVNPFFTQASTSNGGASGTTTAGAPTTSSTTTTTTTTTNSGSGNLDDGDFDPDAINRIAVIHGSLAGIAFVGLFPTGGILIRLFNFPGLIWVHAAVQALAHVLYIIAFGMGIWLMVALQSSGRAHPIIGGLIFLVLLSQPLTGYLHHRLFKRTGGNGGRRAGVSWTHIGIGRGAILLGMINGGLGLWLAGVMGGATIAYAVAAAIMGLTYLTAIVVGERRRSRQQRELQQQQSGETMSAVDSRGHEMVQSGASEESVAREKHVPKHS